MSDGRARRKAKQARRNAARRTRPRSEVTAEEPSTEQLWERLVSGHPLGLLGLMSRYVQQAAPSEWHSKGETPEPMDFSRLVDNVIAQPTPGGGALLAVLAELHDDSVLRQRCRHELSTRELPIAGWASEFAQTQAHKAARMVDVLGDFEYVLVEVHIGEHVLTSMVRVERDGWFEVADAFFFPETLDVVLADLRQHNDERDFNLSEISLADAGARIAFGLSRAGVLPIRKTDNWPNCRPILQWLTRQLPDGGSRYSESPCDSMEEDDLFDRFFTSPVGRPFDDIDCRQMLAEVSSTGTGDLLRWSPACLERVLEPRWPDQLGVPLLSQLELPRLLRAYVPFAHPLVGVREELTGQSLAVIDRLQAPYQQAVLNSRDIWDEGDDAFLGAS